MDNKRTIQLAQLINRILKKSSDEGGVSGEDIEELREAGKRYIPEATDREESLIVLFLWNQATTPSAFDVSERLSYLENLLGVLYVTSSFSTLDIETLIPTNILNFIGVSSLEEGIDVSGFKDDKGENIEAFEFEELTSHTVRLSVSPSCFSGREWFFPDKLAGKHVTSIDVLKDEENNDEKKEEVIIILPRKLKVIEEKAFENLVILNNLRFPSDVQKVERAAFQGSTFAERFVFPYKMNLVSSNTFCKSHFLKGIEFREINIISSNAFHSAIIHKEFRIPKKVRMISDNAFLKTEFKGPVIWESTETILRSESFYSSSFREGFSFPAEGEFWIRDQTFSHCSFDKSIEFPEGLLGINSRAFSHALFKSPFYFPSHEIEMEEGVFSNAIFNKGVIFPSNLKRIYNKMFYAASISGSIELPIDVTHIGEEAFKFAKFHKNFTLVYGEDLVIEEESFSHTIFMENLTIVERKYPGDNDRKKISRFELSKIQRDLFDILLGSTVRGNLYLPSHFRKIESDILDIIEVQGKVIYIKDDESLMSIKNEIKSVFKKMFQFSMRAPSIGD